MHVPKPERVARWRSAGRADRDLAAEIVDRYPHLACYHAQQAIEKSLKAAITDLQGDTVPTHLGRVLLGALADLHVEIPTEIRSAVLAADAYYLPTRYPDALDFADAAETFGASEARTEVAHTDDVIAWTLTIG